jgi:hypothetical protein
MAIANYHTSFSPPTGISAGARHIWNSVFRRRKEVPQRAADVGGFPPVSCICVNTGYPQRLEEAIFSFLQQDYAGPKELIILNDHPAQRLVIDHPEVRIMNLDQPIESRRKKWALAAAACAHDLIFAWNASDISLPKRISFSVDRLSKNENQLTPSTIFIWENERLGGPYHNLFHKGSCWSRRLFDQVGGFQNPNHDADILSPQLRTNNQPSYASLTAGEIFYIFRGLDEIADKSQQPSGEIGLNPHWRDDYSRRVQEHLTPAIVDSSDLSLPELAPGELKKLSGYGYASPRRYYVFEDRRLAYISTAKVACTSIKTAMMQPYGIDHNVHNAWPHIYLGHLATEHRNFFTFSFVRNPFDRLVSGYRNKIFSRPNREEFGAIPTNITFAEFVAEVVKRPDCLINGHFQSQYAKLYQHGQLLVDFLGRFENLVEDWLTIANRFEFDTQLPHEQKSTNKRGVHEDYRTYYTEELVHLVYNRFRADVETFGYQDSYQDLLTFVRGNQAGVIR